MQDQTTKISLSLAASPLVTMVTLFGLGASFMEMSTELLILVMLGAVAVATWGAMRRGKNWHDVERATGEKISMALPAILILLCIGMLVGTWVASGTIPLLVYYGLKFIDPQYLIVTAFLTTAAMSLCTGTSWGSAGTIGVALMGMSAAVDAPLGPTAGAIVSGAYFGDKLSPLSDSTNISAIGAGADLYAHIRHMLYTAVPSFVLAVLIYTFVVEVPQLDGTLPATAQQLLTDLNTLYNLSWLALLPLLVVVTGIVLHIPPVLAMVASAFIAAIIGVGLQGFTLEHSCLSGVRGFDIQMFADKGIGPDAIGPDTVTLVSRGGLYSIATTLPIIIAAFLLAGAMEVSGALDRLIHQMLASVRSTFGLIATTMSAGTTMIGLTSHGGVTALVIGEVFQKAYDERGFARVNLSRSLEDSVTIVEPLLPWTVSAVYMATTLDVPTMTYAPWAIFCLGGPLFSLLYAATYDRMGIGLKRSRQQPSF